jgi:penicillin-binding protein 1A
VTFDKIPKLVVDAFVAAEDNTFWTHGGIDYQGMLRAFLANLRAGHTKEGASTITQQVVKNLLLGSQRTFRRKIQEIILARRLEHALSKQEIMTIYLNQIPFGRNRFGVEEAAKFYFGKDIWQVNVGEAAMLAGMPKEPEALAKALLFHKNPQRAKDRQTYVLNQMAKLGFITPAEAQKWIDAPIQVVQDPFAEMGSAPEWVELVKEELVKTHGEAALDTLGARVRTTLDPTLQAIAQKALQDGLRKVDARHAIARPLHHYDGSKQIAAELDKLAKHLPAHGPDGKDVYQGVVTAVHDQPPGLDVDLGHWQGYLALDGELDRERYNPPDDKGKRKAPGERFKVGDLVQVVLASAAPPAPGDDAPAPSKHPGHELAFAPGPEGAVVIMEVKTRKVRALVGGFDTKAGGFDRATMAHRQAGSSFKPFVYATSFDQAATAQCHANDPNSPTFCGTPATVVNDAPEQIDKWKPKNFEEDYAGPVRLRDALARSINTVSIRIAGEAKPENIITLAHKMGIQSELPDEISLALGAGEVTPLEMVDAYSTIADGGIARPPRFIDAIDGKTLPATDGVQALSPEVAYVMANMMESVTTTGTAARVGAALKIPIAGKTGTSNDARDCWFIGMTPDYAVGVWVGYDDPRPMPGEQGARVAAPIFTDILEQWKQPAKEFVRPPHVVDVTIDKATGLLAPDGSQKDTTMDEVFVEGTQPTSVAPKPGEATESSSVTGEYGD